MYLDPRQRDYAIRTVFGEDPNLSAEAVAHVIRNRTLAGRYGGKDVQGVVQAKHQFEPWNNPEARARMERLAPESPEYQRLGAQVDRVWSGDVPDPTGGATHFYAPKAQAALGRAAPKWASGEGKQIGPHVFYAPEGTVARDGDAEGPPSPMHSAFSGEQRSMDPMAYAMAQNRQQAPQPQQVFAPSRGALNTNAVMGSGALSESNWGGLVNRDGNTDVGNALERASLYLRDSPSALGAMGALKKGAREKDFSFVQGKDGRLFRVNGRTGAVEAVEGAGNSKAQEAYDIEASKEFVAQNNKMFTAAENARQRMTTLDQVDALSRDPNVRQGAGGEWALMGKKVAQAIGMDATGIPESELFNSIAKQMTLELRNPANGAGMPGALSDKDREFLEQANFGLKNTPEGNQRIIAIARKVAQHQIDVDGVRQSYVERNNGRLDGGFQRALSDWSADKRKRLNAEDTASPAPAAPAQRPPLNSFFK